MKKGLITMLIVLVSASISFASTLQEIKDRGVLRHLGVYYANFNTGTGDGFDSEMIQLFAKHIGVEYRHVKASFATVISDLTGLKFKVHGDEVEVLGNTLIKGDLIANGLTILPWRQKIINYSTPTFPTQVWLLAKADSSIKPIIPTGDPEKDIASVKSLLKNKKVLEMQGTCLDASLYNLQQAGALVKSFQGGLGDMAPAIIQGEAEATILDVPDALVALEKWGSMVKIIGPISKFQGMGVGFTKDAAKLKEEFNNFLIIIKNNGAMYKLIQKYYPLAFQFYPEFFNDVKK